MPITAKYIAWSWRRRPERPGRNATEHDGEQTVVNDGRPILAGHLDALVMLAALGTCTALVRAEA